VKFSRVETRVAFRMNNAHRTTWGSPATRLDGDERPSDRKRDGPSPRVHDFLSSRRTRYKRGSNVRHRCWPPSKRYRFRSKFHGISTLETKRHRLWTERKKRSQFIFCAIDAQLRRPSPQSRIKLLDIFEVVRGRVRLRVITLRYDIKVFFLRRFKEGWRQ